MPLALAALVGRVLAALSRLLVLLGFGMGVVRSFFSPERPRALLAGRREGIGKDQGGDQRPPASA